MGAEKPERWMVNRTAAEMVKCDVDLQRSIEKSGGPLVAAATRAQVEYVGVVLVELRMGDVRWHD